MRYTVVWHNDALNDLAKIWLSGADRQATTTAADQIDRELAVDPEKKGQPFFGDRIFVVEPLAVVYCVSPNDRLCEVVQVLSR
jgi:hypothetical protein